MKYPVNRCMTDGWMNGQQKAINIWYYAPSFVIWGISSSEPATAGPELKKLFHAQHVISTAHKIKNAEK